MSKGKMTVKGSYKLKGYPVELEWELPIECLDDVEVFEKIGEEMRRIATFIREQEAKWIREARNLRMQEFALRNLRWLFLPRPEYTENGKLVVEQLKLKKQGKVKQP